MLGTEGWDKSWIAWTRESDCIPPGNYRLKSIVTTTLQNPKEALSAVLRGSLWFLKKYYPTRAIILLPPLTPTCSKRSYLTAFVIGRVLRNLITSVERRVSSTSWHSWSSIQECEQNCVTVSHPCYQRCISSWGFHLHTIAPVIILLCPYIFPLHPTSMASTKTIMFYCSSLQHCFTKAEVFFQQAL